jgi:hypothetical protein
MAPLGRGGANGQGGGGEAAMQAEAAPLAGQGLFS